MIDILRASGPIFMLILVLAAVIGGLALIFKNANKDKYKGLKVNKVDDDEKPKKKKKDQN